MTGRPTAQAERLESSRSRAFPRRLPERVRVVALALLLALSGSGAIGCTGSSGRYDVLPADHPDARAFLAAHNHARATVAPPPKTPLPPLRWSHDLASLAAKTAARCRFAHGPVDVGENLAARSQPHPPADAVAIWMAERAEWDPGKQLCRTDHACGHFTQVVWRESRELGCASRLCERGSPMGSGPWYLTVCNYAPAGNVSGDAPY